MGRQAAARYRSGTVRRCHYTIAQQEDTSAAHSWHGRILHSCHPRRLRRQLIYLEEATALLAAGMVPLDRGLYHLVPEMHGQLHHPGHQMLRTALARLRQCAAALQAQGMMATWARHDCQHLAHWAMEIASTAAVIRFLAALTLEMPAPGAAAW